MREKHYWRTAVMILLSSISVGCRYLPMPTMDAFYFLRIENHTQQHLVVEVLVRDIEIGPCSVYLSHITGPTQENLGVRVTDLDGHGVDTATFTSGQEKDWGAMNPVLIVRIPPEPQQGCPKPIEDRFLLTVHNWTTEDLPIALSGTVLGIVPAQSQRIFGPVEGTWREIDFPTVPDPTGDDRLRRPGLNDLTGAGGISRYNIGDIPNINVHITQ